MAGTADKVIIGELAVAIWIDFLEHHVLLLLTELQAEEVTSPVELLIFNAVILGLIEKSVGLLEVAKSALNADPENI